MRGHPLGAGPWSGRNSTGGERRPWTPIPGDGRSQEHKTRQMDACSQSPGGGNGKTGRFGSGRARSGPSAQQKVIWPPEAGALTGPGPRRLKQHVPEGRRLEWECVPDAAGPAGPWRRRQSGGPRGRQWQLPDIEAAAGCQGLRSPAGGQMRRIALYTLNRGLPQGSVTQTPSSQRGPRWRGARPHAPQGDGNESNG